MEAKFTGPSFTLGVEEELMILDGESFELANEVEAVIGAYEGEGEVKPELLQSVLEIATPPCKDVTEVSAHVRRLRREVAEVAAASETSRRSRRTCSPASATFRHGGVAISSTDCSSSGLTSPSPS